MRPRINCTIKFLPILVSWQGSYPSSVHRRCCCYIEPSLPDAPGFVQYAQAQLFSVVTQALTGSISSKGTYEAGTQRGVTVDRTLTLRALHRDPRAKHAATTGILLTALQPQSPSWEQHCTTRLMLQFSTQCASHVPSSHSCLDHYHLYKL